MTRRKVMHSIPSKISQPLKRTDKVKVKRSRLFLSNVIFSTYLVSTALRKYPRRVCTALSLADPNLTPIRFFTWLRMMTMTAA